MPDLKMLVRNIFMENTLKKTPSPGSFKDRGTLDRNQAEFVEGLDSIVTLTHSEEKYMKCYMKHFIYHFTSILHGLIRTHKSPAPNISGFIAQLVRASHWYCKVTGSNPVEVLTSGFYTQLLKLRS